MAVLIKDCRYLIKNSTTVLEHVDVLVEGSSIKKVGKNIDSPVGSKDLKVIDASGKVVMPGLVNAHTHLYQALLKGVRDDLAFKEWCEKVTFPLANIVHQDHWNHNDIELGYCWAMLASIEMIKSGTTCFIDMDLTLDSIFQAWLDIGIRGIGAITAVNRWIPKNLSRGEDVRKKEIVKYIEKWNCSSTNQGLVKVFVAPSTPFACTPGFLEWLYQTAERYDLGIQIHVSENLWEVENSIQETGYPPMEYLERLNLLRRPISAVHCVHLQDHEIEMAKESGVTVVYNPKSNMKLGSGTAPIVKMLQKGVPVALATDGPASNDLMDMFEEMRTGALLQKVAWHDPSVISANDMFHMATVNGARAAGINAGTIEEGKLADLIILDLFQAHSMPLHDIIQTVVYCAKGNDVETTIINGKVVMENKKLLTIDEKETLNRIHHLARTKLARWDDRQLTAEF